MRLQRQLAGIYQGKKYNKWVIIIPPQHIKTLEWKEGQELVSEVRKGQLMVREPRHDENKPHDATYEEFREQIRHTLADYPKGLTWSEIKEIRSLPQKVPNNLWVRMMERDIGLIREKVGTKTIWRLK